MTVAKDELFCRLAIRQGILTKDDATQVLRDYRSEGKTDEDIGKFAVRQGYLDQETVGALEGAIAHRAEGHVADSRRRVPKVRKGGGHAHAHHHHHHHHHARPSAKNASTGQLVAVSVGAVVLIGAVIMLIFQFTGAEPTVDSSRGKGDGSTSKPDTVKKFDADALKKPAQITLSEKDRENYENRVDGALMTARQEASDGRYWSGIKVLMEMQREFGGTQAPAMIQDLMSSLTEQETELRELLNERYGELTAELQKATSPEEVQATLDEIERVCGRDKKDEATKNAPNP